MTDLEKNLRALLQALAAVSDACIANGDYTDNFRVIGAMQQVSAAITIAAAKDIVATLPNDADSKKIKDMLARMGDAAQRINAAEANVTHAVQVATAFANVIADVNGNQIGSALGVVGTLSGILG